ncbi:inositol monophosphatase family protein [Gymnodinialimonas sp. 2305UL16-5]|uniref:inositol monophosphatase family protein n=1 Tax=Gymnodinialimonas mytili TaxID=3126503 RepID=UPI0030B0DDD2
MSTDARLNFAVEIAEAAGDLAQRLRRAPGGLEMRTKARLDFVTQADLACEQLLRQRIADAFPGDGILGEEGGFDGNSEAYWILDPIDGTTNFSRGMREWAVSVAYYDGCGLTHGVIAAPDLGILACASAGGQAHVNGEAVDLTRCQPHSAPMVALGYSAKMPLEQHLDRISRLMSAGIEHRRHGAATIGFLGVLLGWFDAYFEPQLNLWDTAAGSVLLSAAGGRISHAPIPSFVGSPAEVFAENGAIAGLSDLLKGPPSTR